VASASLARPLFVLLEWPKSGSGKGPKDVGKKVKQKNFF
jgi:hypothetical protein